MILPDLVHVAADEPEGAGFGLGQNLSLVERGEGSFAHQPPPIDHHVPHVAALHIVDQVGNQAVARAEVPIKASCFCRQLAMAAE